MMQNNKEIKMSVFRRDFLKLASTGLAGAATASILTPGAQAAPVSAGSGPGTVFNVRMYGAKGDGTTIDTPAVNKAIEAASNSGGGTVLFPAGVYACYSIHLKNNVALYLEMGSTILAADVPDNGVQTGNCYDPAESNAPWEEFQDYGHNHWHNSLIWGEGLQNIAILGPGLIWGKGLSRGSKKLPRAETPGIGNKSISLKNCHNVILRDFSILKGGHFGILATGVDNLTIDNLKIDTDRDGMDIDCCRNVRVSNCSVNSPWDDAICPKSSYALGYARSTENVTISNCYVTGAYALGTMLDGTWKPWVPDSDNKKPNGGTGRIKCGTESNGGFKNITITNCVFDGCHGFALETSDGAILEDVTVTGLTMRNVNSAPIFLRLNARLRGPKETTQVGSLKRVIISNVVCYNTDSKNIGGAIISGIPGHMIEDIKLSDIYMHHTGGGTPEMAAKVEPEYLDAYPDPSGFGSLPASTFFVRHVKNIEFTNVEVANAQPDARPIFIFDDVDGIDLFRIRTPKENGAPVFSLKGVHDFRIAASRAVKDTVLESADGKTL